MSAFYYEKQKKLREQEAQKPTPTPQDIGFFDPSLHQDFPELNLYHDVNVFTDRLRQCQNECRDADILQLLPKCLRGATFGHYQSMIAKDMKWKTHACVGGWRITLLYTFKKNPFDQSATQSVTQEAPQSPHATPQLPEQKYHKCPMFSASFSSINRVLSHSQTATYGKSSCNHFEEVFDAKNKLHDHIRDHECQTFLSSKSATAIKTALTQLSTPEKDAINDADIAIKKGVIEYSTHTTQ